MTATSWIWKPKTSCLIHPMSRCTNNHNFNIILNKITHTNSSIYGLPLRAPNASNGCVDHWEHVNAATRCRQYSLVAGGWCCGSPYSSSHCMITVQCALLSPKQPSYIGLRFIFKLATFCSHAYMPKLPTSERKFKKTALKISQTLSFIKTLSVDMSKKRVSK